MVWANLICCISLTELKIKLRKFQNSIKKRGNLQGLLQVQLVVAVMRMQSKGWSSKHQFDSPK